MREEYYDPDLPRYIVESRAVCAALREVDAEVQERLNKLPREMELNA